MLGRSRTKPTEPKPRRTKLSFDEFKAQTMRFFKTQKGADVPESVPDTSRKRMLSTGKVARVISGGSGSASSDESDTEQSIRRIIRDRNHFSISKVDEASLSKEASRSLSAGEEDTSHVPDLQESMLRLQEEEKHVRTQKQQDRKQVFMQVIAQLSGDKSCSLSLSQEQVSSGSETEKPGDVSETSETLISVVKNLIEDKRKRRELMRVIEENHGQKLSICLRENQVEGVYCHEAGGLRKLFSLKDAPDVVTLKKVRKCYRLQGGVFRPLPLKQVWSADAFST